MEDIFDKFTVISIYTDDQAVADGVLVDISSFKLHLNNMPVNRITGHLYHELMACSAHDTTRLRDMLNDKINLIIVINPIIDSSGICRI